MKRRLLGLATATAVAVLGAACDQAPPSAPQDTPAFKPVPPPAFPCLFTGNPSLGSAINGYFTVPADKKTASDIAAAMQNGFTGSDPYAGARDLGFDLLSFLGQVSRRGGGSSPGAGALVAQYSVQCMFNVSLQTGKGQDFEGWPTANQFDFASSLNFAAGGALYVRGKPGIGGDPATDPVVGTKSGLSSASGNLSALGLPDPTTQTWSQVLSTRTLIYGEPVFSSPLVMTGYDWKLIPRRLGSTIPDFTPYAVIALCQGLRPGVPPDEAFSTTELVHQQNLGFLGATAATTLCGTAAPTAMLNAPAGRFEFVGRLLRAADQLFGVHPLVATTVATTKGGTTSTAKTTEYTLDDVSTVQLDVTVQPPRSMTVSSTRFNLSVKVSTPPEPVGGVAVQLSVVNNSGPTHIFEITAAGLANNYPGCNPNDNLAGQPPYVVDASETTETTIGLEGTTETVAKWDKNDPDVTKRRALCIDKTGTATILAESFSAGAPDAAQGSTSTNPTNVKGQ
jgi:hypothetical protein